MTLLGTFSHTPSVTLVINLMAAQQNNHKFSGLMGLHLLCAMDALRLVGNVE